MHKSTNLLKPKSLKIILTITFLLLIGFVCWFMWKSPEKYTIFKGAITAKSNGCTYDDICTITVDNKRIVTGGGLSANPEENMYGRLDLDLKPGDSVEVKALNTSNGLTLQGCRECYIKRRN